MRKTDSPITEEKIWKIYGIINIEYGKHHAKVSKNIEDTEKKVATYILNKFIALKVVMQII